MFRKVFAMVVLAPLAATGLRTPSMALAQDTSSGPVLVLGAASVTNVIDELGKQFTRETGMEVSTSYAGTSVLAQQIVHGVDADLFISADEKWADFLADKGLIAEKQNLLGSHLVVVVPKDSSLILTKIQDLALPTVEHLALGDPEGVPAGRYAQQLLIKLGIWDEVKGKVVAAEDVRHALIFVETGSAQAGIVYATDATASTKVKVAIDVPADLTTPVRYPVALLKHGQGRANAEAFYHYLMSPAAAKVFQRYGFSVFPPTSVK